MKWAMGDAIEDWDTLIEQPHANNYCYEMDAGDTPIEQSHNLTNS